MEWTVEQRKQQARDNLRKRRSDLPDRACRGKSLLQHLDRWSSTQTSQSVLCYVGVRDEVETRPWIEQRLRRESDDAVGLTTAIPFCVQNQLKLYRLREWDELQPGRFGVPEPRQNLRDESGRIITPAEIDLFVVPGVGFDRAGRRLGYGGGYFDRLLAERKIGSIVVALAFDCQLADSLPNEPHDQRVEWIITETGVIDCRNGR